MTSSDSSAARRISFKARAGTRAAEVLRSPVSGVACVYWRLRVTEEIDPRLHLVHELASSEGFDLDWSPSPSHAPDAGTDGAPALQVSVAPESARIEATPVLHRRGSPGALAVAQAFGFAGALSVEEVALRPGEEVAAVGVLEDYDAAAAPFRGVSRQIQLHDAVLRLPGRATIGPVLLPWALGTAAAVLGGVSAAAWAAWHFHLLPAQDTLGAVAPQPELGPRRPSRPRLP